MSSQELQSKTESIHSEVDGTVLTFFSGYDGIVIFKSVPAGSEADSYADNMAAHLVEIISKFKAGGMILENIVATCEGYILCLKVMKDGFFVIALTKEGNVGRAKIELNKLGNRFIDA
jgi:predicted regulator of Ras-like GTPase activity (Roadblock/LC7/MglB family)